MSREEIFQTINEIACDVFEDSSLELTDETTADDVAAWDSLTHLGFINEIELEFGMKFTLAEIRGFRNVGELVDTVAKAIINSHCEAVLCGQIYNKKLFDKIADEGITRYNAAGMPLRQAIDAMNKYQLNYIRDYVGGTGCHEHHHGD